MFVNELPKVSEDKEHSAMRSGQMWRGQCRELDTPLVASAVRAVAEMIVEELREVGEAVHWSNVSCVFTESTLCLLRCLAFQCPVWTVRRPCAREAANVGQ